MEQLKEQLQPLSVKTDVELRSIERLCQNENVGLKGDVSPLYEMEDLLTMLSGTEFYSMDQIQYVYYKLRGEEDEAQYFLNILTNQQVAYQKKLNRMKIGIADCETVEYIKILT